LFDRDTCTYTYLLADETTGDAVLIDSVLEHVDRDVKLVRELGVNLKAVIETHVHADHVTGGGSIRQQTGAKYAISAASNVACADIQLEDGDPVVFGAHTLEVRNTPGHTRGCASFYLPDSGMIFTGDALFIRGCGRTDFQGGSARTLFASVHGRILTLPEHTRIYPGHDYNGRTVTTVEEEKFHNPRLGGGRSVEEFEEIMAGLDLSYPARIDDALPANLDCGVVQPARVSADV